MIDLVSDLILRIANSDSAELRRIYHHEIQAKGWSDEEREAILKAHNTRACWLNKLAIRMEKPRWSTPEAKG